MNIFQILTPLTYWVLVAMWIYILLFLLQRLRLTHFKRSLPNTLITILAINALRTLFESLYFGAWYTSRSGFLPIAIYDFLVRPEIVVIPKLLNVSAAALIIGILFYRWFPAEKRDRELLENTIKERTNQLEEINEQLRYEITERQRAEELLKTSDARYKELYNKAPDMFASVDATNAHVLECNEALVRATGYTQEEIIGRPIFDLYHPDSLEGAKRAFELFTITGEVHDAELQLKKKDGSKLEVSLNVSSIRDQQGNILQSLSIWRDITEHKRLEVELEKTHNHLEERVEERTEELHKTIRLMAGRENRMAELKQKIKKLHAQLKKAGIAPETVDSLEDVQGKKDDGAHV